MKVAAFVPIKLNSERVPQKNIRNLGNKKLCNWILEELVKVKGIDDSYVFCSDSAIAEALPPNIKFKKRPEYLDQNSTLGWQIYDEFVAEVEADYYILAHATSPFVRASTMEKALDMVLERDFDSAFTTRPIQNFCWFDGVPINYELNEIPRTQDLVPVYEETSAFFIFSRELWLREQRRIGHRPYIVQLDEIEGVDIDTELDFALAQSILSLGLHD